MICCSLRHRGQELLGQRGGLANYVGVGSTMGIPFLHPWANRLGASRFELAGREGGLDLGGVHVKRGAGGLPRDGLLTAGRGWAGGPPPVAGREADLDLEGVHVKRDASGLPMHGLLTAARGWQVDRHLELEDEAEGGVLAASFDFGAHPLLTRAFPFPHRLEIEARLAGAE